MEKSGCSTFFGFEWKIANALYVDLVDSDEFSYDGHRWKLSFRIHACFRDIFLSKTSSGNLFNTYKVRCFIENTSKAFVIPFECDLDATFSTLKVYTIDTNSTIYGNTSNRDQYIKNGTLTFFITFTAKDGINDKVSDKCIQTSVSMDTVSCLGNLSLDLHHLMEDGCQSDITLQCEERSFPAHKGILSARSQVFSAMFRSDMSENRSGCIEISDMDASILSQFLQYIYSGKLSDLSEDTVYGLYAAADKYAVESLKNQCAKFMTENLTKENACKILVLADMHKDINLKNSALNFIINIELLQDEDIWFGFQNEHPKLASEVLYQVYKAKCSSKNH